MTLTGVLASSFMLITSFANDVPKLQENREATAG